MDSLTIDFANRDDIRAKLPEARKRLADLEEASRALNEEMADWRHFVDTLARRAASGPHAAEAERSETVPTATAPAEPFKDVIDAPVGDDAAPKPLAQPPLDLAVGVVNRENRKIKSSDVAKILRREGHDVKNVVISNALFYGAKRADPPRVKQAQGRGYYAPLEYAESPIAVNPVLNNGADISAEQNLNRHAVQSASGDGTGRDSPGGPM